MKLMVLAMLCYCNPESNLVEASIEKLSDQFGLSTISKIGNKSITRASRLITHFMEPMGFVTCKKIWDKVLGNYMPKMIKLTPLFFMLFDVSEKKLINAKKQQLGWINKNLIIQGIKPITISEAKIKAKEIHMKNLFKYRISHTKINCL